MSTGGADGSGRVIPYAVPERRKPSEGTYAVNGVRARVDAWRAQGYPRSVGNIASTAGLLVR